MEIQSGDCRPRPIVTKTSGRAARPGAKDCERDAGASGRARTGGESPAMNSGPKWSLRNGAQYQRLCARAGCGAAAVATLRFQSTERQAWLVDLDVNASRTQGDLCQRHAAALVLPRGWELHDERASAVAPPAPEPVEVVEREVVEPEVVEPEVVEPEVDAPEVDGSGPRSVPAQFGSNDDDDAVV